MSEQKVLEVGGRRYEVSEDFLGAFNKVTESLVAAGIPAGAVVEAQAWTVVHTMIDAGLLKASAKPKEVVPNLAELADPIVQKSLTAGAMRQAVDNYLAAQADFESALESAGLDVGLTIGSGSAAAYITLSQSFGEGDVTAVYARVKRESTLAKSAMKTTETLRYAEASVYAIVKAVADKHGITTDKVKVTCSVARDGTVSLTGKKGSKPRAHNSGNSSRYSYDFKDGLHQITRNGEPWVASDARTETELLSAIKGQMEGEGKTFASVHWRGSPKNAGRTWWPY